MSETKTESEQFASAQTSARNMGAFAVNFGMGIEQSNTFTALRTFEDCIHLAGVSAISAALAHRLEPTQEHIVEALLYSVHLIQLHFIQEATLMGTNLTDITKKIMALHALQMALFTDPDEVIDMYNSYLEGNRETTRTGSSSDGQAKPDTKGQDKSKAETDSGATGTQSGPNIGPKDSSKG